KGWKVTLPEKPVKLASHTRDTTGVSQMFPSSKARTNEDSFTTLPRLVSNSWAEVSGISEADPQALLQAMKDLDGMDADILGLKKSNPAPSKKAAKDPGKGELLSHPKPAGGSVASEKGAWETAPRIYSEDAWGDKDFTFGAYQPTVVSSEGQQSRRQSVSRFLADSGPDPKGEPGSKQNPPTASSPIQPRKGGADWLGLKDEDLDLLPASPTREARRESSVPVTPSVPPPASQHSMPAGLPRSRAKPATEGAGSPAKAGQASKLRASKEEKEEDWLSHALSQKKSQGLAREQHAGTSEGLSLVGTAGHPPSGSQPVTSTQGLEHAAAGGSSGTTARERPCVRPSEVADLSWAPVPSLARNTSLPLLQSLLPESLAWSLLLGTEYQKQLLAARVQLQSRPTELQAKLLQSQTRLEELVAQVQKLELERAQHELLLGSLQQQHQADLELIESAHRSRIKVLETSYQQREERLRRENEELSARYLSHCQEAEQARAELTAQHQRRLAAIAQEKDQEMERLRELQRASILDMRRDHEEQLQRLKLLKDREVDAATSATSHTRLEDHLKSGVRDQPGQHGETKNKKKKLARRAGLLERLRQENRMILRAGTTLSVLPWALQERWRVTAEQSKAESMQRALEEQRKVTAQQMAMERAELERAKSALLEEQKSVMLKCGEERRRLAAEWAEFSAQQKLSKERAEREAERALQVDTQREGTLISLAKQAELKIRASELRAEEKQLAAERAALEQERQELRLEKERINATALRVKLRAEEVESMSKVASEKYEEGERALREARQVQAEQQARLQAVQQQQERLRKQEQHMHQEHLSLAQQRLHWTTAGITGMSQRAQPALMPPAPTTRWCSQPPTGLDPSPLHLHAREGDCPSKSALQDRDFLENEQFFLETLKKRSHNLTSHSA
uniref:Fas binding factor 1 n=1 Tax=Nomascus leucogenys TaxID=61853 RepID=A0A2I3HL35_NOMLE